MGGERWFYRSDEDWDAICERLKQTACPHCKVVGMPILDVARLSPGLTYALAHRLELGSTEQIDLFQRACDRHRRDFWLSMSIAHALRESRLEAAMGYYRLAIAQRPDNGTPYNDLGVAYLRAPGQ